MDDQTHVEHVYGELMRRHMAAAREDFHGERRKNLFSLIEAIRAEWPEGTARWEARYTDTNSPQGVHPHADPPRRAASLDLAAS